MTPDDSLKDVKEEIRFFSSISSFIEESFMLGFRHQNKD